jgi:O-antigen/teichoic acid export membrane protein
MNYSAYWKHVGTVLGGSIGAQALPLLAAPLITRMCTPSELGAFAVWLGVVAVSAIAATLRLETAMILDHETEQQRVCFTVVFHAATITAVLVSLCALAAHAAGLPALHDQSWIGLTVVGLGTWLTAYTQTTLSYATSHKAFGKAAHAKILGAGTIALTQLLLLWLGAGEAGLLAGQVIGLTAGCWPPSCCCAHRVRASACASTARRAPTCGGTRNSGAIRCRRTCSTPWSASCRCS